MASIPFYADVVIAAGTCVVFLAPGNWFSDLIQGPQVREVEVTNPWDVRVLNDGALQLEIGRVWPEHAPGLQVYQADQWDAVACDFGEAVE